MNSDLIIKLGQALYDYELIKFGNFTLHSGVQSPVYFDLRNLISAPDLMKTVIAAYVQALNDHLDEFDVIVGPAYGAVAIATGISLSLEKPMMIVRKEAKQHGTGGRLIGDVEPGLRVLLVDDVVTSGTSLKEVAEILESAGYQVDSALVLIDRRAWNQRTETLPETKIKIKALMTVEQVLRVLGNYRPVINSHSAELQLIRKNPDWFPDLKQRAKFPGLHPQVKRLLKIMILKETRLVLSADLTWSNDLIKLVEKIGPEIAALKLHSEILVFENASREVWEFYQKLEALAAVHNFLLMEDRKLADIGMTTMKQLRRLDWADLITAHLISGPGVIQACAQVNQENGRNQGLLLLAQMSSAGNLITPEYTQAVVKAAQENPQVVAGLISQEPLLDARFIQMTPGVRLDKNHDDLGQTYRRPEKIDTDLFIVGRGILEAEDPLAAAREYRIATWRE